MDKIGELRKLMKKNNIDAYIILTDDFHGSEYVGEYFKARELMSGFDGSAGSMVVTENDAGLWTDGRYFLQAEKQLEGSGIRLFREGEQGVLSIPDYLRRVLDSHMTIGYDGRTVNGRFGMKLRQALPDNPVCDSCDLVNEIWKDRPGMPKEPVWLLDEKYTGMSRREKLARIREKMQTDLHLVTTLDDIAWILNMRGGDIEYNPTALSYLLIKRCEALLYIEPDKVSEEIEKELARDGVYIRRYDDIYTDMEKTEEPVMLDKNCCNMALLSVIGSIHQAGLPSSIMKACKNETEVRNEREAHIKDGLALTRFIYRIKHSEGETEMSAAALLESLRCEGGDYLGQSFAPIIASGDHGAIVHYEAVPETDRLLADDGFILMDTGGHYLQGTTDVTRTITRGMLTEEEKRCYTAVLAGNLNIASARFKKGCSGSNIDYLARSPLWEMDLDYRHGTGHGVGYLLNVHEGPNAIRLKNADTPFEEGMITSDEPGVYLEGKFGIRLENLICAHEDNGFVSFETLTLVPFERAAVIPEMLTEKQKKALNEYHEKVYKTISPHLEQEEAEWLYAETRPFK